ncbi:unnamed protein product [Rotaria sp. Silwood1]|nr:unnamed protein product [Rotaria sp. Silwood1]CAF1372143.1 unnamed protein product [Rotaria sp. Silwood1]CAF3582721.1 unnamed protein product [Rotaria sp. Silwood1]CAF4689383.1 unnamed protein product [Rotaria sp. Silwood1]CAF4727375.1 unnamed protein product [Rotaria sp. Silwood1]
MAAANDLSNFVMATTTPSLISNSILNSSTVNSNFSKWPNDISLIDKYNWLLHIMYGRGEYDRIQQFIRIQLHRNTYMTYIQALVYRQEGRIIEALEYFQKCVLENPSLTNIKQVAKSLALLGRYRLAIDAYKEALTYTINDWEIFHNLGLCYMHINELQQAKQYFLQAIQITEIQEASFLALGKIYLLEGEREEAETIYEQGTRRNPESVELFTQIGLIAFERANYTKAFECFGIALTFSPTHIPAIMAACQVIQKHGDADVALSKYRIIYGRKPECAQVWNNIGMCFFSKKKLVAAVSCLKRANYLAPFELYILYNLALVHLYLQQNASAAIFLQSAIRINKKHAPSYALLGVALSKLNDFDNALKAFIYSLKLDPTDPMTLLNLAILQMNTGVSQSIIDKTLKEFHQYYSERTALTTHHQIDTSMLDFAAKLKVTQSTTISNNEEVAPSLSRTAIYSPREPFDKDSMISSR